MYFMFALSKSDWPLRVQGGPGKTILIWALVIIGALAVLAMIEWRKWPAWIDGVTKNRWNLVKNVLGRPDDETKTIKKWACFGIGCWFAIILILAMFVPSFGQKQVHWSQVVSTYEISEIKPAQDFDRRLLVNGGFKLSSVKGAAYPVTFLGTNANVESNGLIQVNGTRARLVSIDGSPQPSVKTGRDASLFGN